MEFNSAFKGLMLEFHESYKYMWYYIVDFTKY
jgi:hypothetical protein